MNIYFKKFSPWISLELTNKCNLNCIMCTVRKKDCLDEGFMDLQTVIKFTDDLLDSKIKYEGLRLFWLGEPTIHPKFSEILDILNIEELKRKGIIKRIGIDTNCHGLDDKKINSIINLSKNIPFHMIISIDAIKKATYENIRKGGDFSKVTDAIENILKQRLKQEMLFPKISLQFIVMEENKNELSEFLNHFTILFRKFGIEPKIQLNGSFATHDGFNIRPMTWQEDEDNNRQDKLNNLYIETIKKCGLF